MSRALYPRPKPPSAYDAYAEIRRARDAIRRAEGRKPVDLWDANTTEPAAGHQDEYR